MAQMKGEFIWIKPFDILLLDRLIIIKIVYNNKVLLILVQKIYNVKWFMFGFCTFFAEQKNLIEKFDEIKN